MINLIPPEAKKRVKVEYWIRISSVALMLISSAFIAVAALHIPVYVLVDQKLGAYETVFNQANVQNEAFKESEEILIEANLIARELVSDNKTVPLSSLFKIFDDLGGNAISISKFEFEQSENDLTKINISGISQNRQALVAFRDAIDNDPLFQSVELPLSNLAKDSDIPFSLDVKPSKKTNTP